MDDRLIARILADHPRIAVVGLSRRVSRPSHEVSAYMQRAGYTITPVNPHCEEVLGVRCHPDLADAASAGPLGIVNLFRPPDAVPPFVDQAIALGADAIWMQIGIVHEGAAREARAAGIPVVMDRCIRIEHARFGGPDPG